MNDKSEKYPHVFESVRALYLGVREAQDLRIPIRLEAVDFLCDVELKARRVLSPVEFNMFRKGLELPFGAKAELGEVFHRCRLSAGGDYTRVYRQIQQAAPSLEERDRKAI